MAAEITPAQSRDLLVLETDEKASALRAAARTNVARTERLRALVLEVLAAAPAGLTADEIAAKLAASVLAVRPRLIVADEPTSALDMLIQAQIVDLLRTLQKRRNLTYMFISHDLRVVAALASHVVVMRHGKVMEEGPAAQLFAAPKSDYTRALLAAAFNLESAPEGVVAQ